MGKVSNVKNKSKYIKNILRKTFREDKQKYFLNYFQIYKTHKQNKGYNIYR